jgi:predicted AlkP superfamily pyrophosphatase or phosphodiesterase
MKIILYILVLILNISAIAQKKAITTKPTLVIEKAASKPKLIVGIVLDQMRWDYLYKFAPVFKPNGGFNKLLNNGFTCNNTMIPYTPTVTACGHTCIYTGSVPAIHGITGNHWFDKLQNKKVYCSEDKTVKGIGNAKEETGQMSPKNMLTTTICDELRLASNFTNKTIGIAVKDRGAILPAGHSANAAFWFDNKNGNFVTSSYYMQQLPNWLVDFNNRKLPDSLYKLGWVLDVESKNLTNLTNGDAHSYEAKPFGKDQETLAYNFDKFIGKDYSKIASSPAGNTLTTLLAKATIIGEQLGQNNQTDFLALSYSSTDYIGHSFGPNSYEILDCYQKMDNELDDLLLFLDTKIGKDNYTIFLTSDHAVANIPAYLNENKLPGGVFDDEAVAKILNQQLLQQFSINKAIVASDNYQFTLNHQQLDSLKIDEALVSKIIIDYLKKQEAIATAFSLSNLSQTNIQTKLKEMLINGYFENRCGDIQFVLKPGYIDGMNKGTTHGLWYNYDAHIPLIFYGNGIKKGASTTQNYMTDIAPTIAALLNIQMPNGSIGKVINEVLK